MNDQERDVAIAKHVDAIRALLRPADVMALMCWDDRGSVWFVAPEGRAELIGAALTSYLGDRVDTPEST